MKNPKKILLPAFCAASFLSLAGCGSGPGKTYVNCTRFFADGNTGKALTCMDPSLMQKPGAKEKMSAMISMASAKVKGEHKGIAKVNLLEEKIDGDMATVKVHIKYSDGTEQDDSGSLKRIDRKWYLIN